MSVSPLICMLLHWLSGNSSSPRDVRWSAHIVGYLTDRVDVFYISCHIWAHSRQRDQPPGPALWVSAALQQNKASFTVCVRRKGFHLLRMFGQKSVERRAENSVASHQNITPQHHQTEEGAQICCVFRERWSTQWHGYIFITYGSYLCYKTKLAKCVACDGSEGKLTFPVVECTWVYLLKYCTNLRYLYFTVF